MISDTPEVDSGYSGRLRVQRIDHAAHQGSVAVDVRADLHEWRAAVATGQGHHVGLGQDRRHDHRTPAHALEAEDEAHLLGERAPR